MVCGVGSRGLKCVVGVVSSRNTWVSSGRIPGSQPVWYLFVQWFLMVCRECGRYVVHGQNCLTLLGFRYSSGGLCQGITDCCPQRRYHGVLSTAL